jgi:hypothetical protein
MKNEVFLDGYDLPTNDSDRLQSTLCPSRWGYIIRNDPLGWTNHWKCRTATDNGRAAGCGPNADFSRQTLQIRVNPILTTGGR